MLSEVHLEKARREVVASPVGLPVSQGEGPSGGANPGIIAGEVPLLEGGDGDLAGKACGLLAPLNRGGCWTSHQYPSCQIANGYPMNEHFQWQCHTRKDRSVFRTVVP